MRGFLSSGEKIAAWGCVGFQTRPSRYPSLVPREWAGSVAGRQGLLHLCSQWTQVRSWGVGMTIPTLQIGTSEVYCIREVVDPLCFRFCLFLCILLFSLWFLQWSHGCWVAYCLAATSFCFLEFISNLMALWSEKMLNMNFNFLKFYQGLPCGWAWSQSRRTFHVHLRRCSWNQWDLNGMFIILDQKRQKQNCSLSLSHHWAHVFPTHHKPTSDRKNFFMILLLLEHAAPGWGRYQEGM